MRCSLFPGRAERFGWPRTIAIALTGASLFDSASIARSAEWTGDFFTSDWFSSLAWYHFDGPPGAGEDAYFNDRNPVDPLLSVANTSVNLSANTTIRILSVTTPAGSQYTFTGSNGAKLTATTATTAIQLGNGDLQALNVHTFTSLGLNSPRVDLFHNAVLSLSGAVVTTDLVSIDLIGRVEVNANSQVLTNAYGFGSVGGEIRVNSGGRLRLAADASITSGLITINEGGQLGALPGVDLEHSSLAQLRLFRDTPSTIRSALRPPPAAALQIPRISTWATAATAAPAPLRSPAPARP